MAALLVGMFVFAAKLCAALREVAIAWRYGVSAMVDAYQLALTISTWLPLVLTSAATVVLVPKLVGLRREPHKYHRFIRQLNGMALIFAFGIMVLTITAAPLVVGLLAGELDSSMQALVGMMVIELAPVTALALIGGYFSARLQARERYGYSLAEGIPALAVALMVFAGSYPESWRPLVWGTLLGFVLQAAWLTAMIRANDSPIGRVEVGTGELRLLYVPLLVMLLGQIVISVSTPLDQAFAVNFGEGAVATLGYANRIISLIVGFGSVVVARALLPTLSAAVANGEHLLGKRQVVLWSILLFGLGSASAAIGWMLARPAVTVLFERGAFTAEDSGAVAGILRLGLLQLPFYFGGMALVQWFAASNRHHVLLWASALALVTKIAMNILLIQPLGLAGLMAATSGMYAMSFLTLLFWVISDK